VTFRIALTSAQAVDTGAQPGQTSVYIDKANELLGFRGFLGGDRDSVIQRQFLTGGQRLRIDGGGIRPGVESPQMAMPYIDLESSQIAAGSPPTYQPVTRLITGGGAAGKILQDSITYPVAAGDQPGIYPTFAPGIGEWTDTAFQHLKYLFVISTGLVFVNGLVAVTGALTANKVTSHSGGYAPLVQPNAKGTAPILPGAVSDAARLFDVRADGIYLRGAAPTVGQWISVTGFWESSLRTP
jgi:hypothetical protein